MRVLGIDPGTLHLGWGIVQAQGNRLEHVSHGVVDVNGKLALADRLVHIEQALCQIIERWRPEVGAVESLFFHRDAQAAAKLGHARGVVLLTLAREGLPVFEYAPARVKLTVAGRGQAEKSQVGMMVRTYLALDARPPSDAADALAVAVTHLRRLPIDQALLGKGAESLGRGPCVRSAGRGRSPSGPRAAKARLMALIAAAKAQ